jgi:hypothetical protein
MAVGYEPPSLSSSGSRVLDANSGAAFSLDDARLGHLSVSVADVPKDLCAAIEKELIRQGREVCHTRDTARPLASIERHVPPILR